ncbi:UL36 very large tegument protein [Streptomyces diastatochromogenes]|nr:UL36 very large tegument protein [Streptomyces diastatochromogenes]
MEGERRYAETRSRELAARLRATPDPARAARLEHDLAWARDDHARATARVGELTQRLARLGRSPRARRTARPLPCRPGSRTGSRAPWPRRRPAGPDAEGAGPPGQAAARGARYAWLEEGPRSRWRRCPSFRPGSGSSGRAVRRGRRHRRRARDPRRGPRRGRPRRANAVYALRRLRAQGRSGEAHVLLCEALGGPPARLPALAAELHRAGLGADWSTLLWEAASLPPGRSPPSRARSPTRAGRPTASSCSGRAWPARSRSSPGRAPRCAPRATTARRTPCSPRSSGSAPRGRRPARGRGPARAGAPAPRRRPRGVGLPERDLLHALRVAGLTGA